jgi:hypothetical protein
VISSSQTAIRNCLHLDAVNFLLVVKTGFKANLLKQINSPEKCTLKIELAEGQLYVRKVPRLTVSK